MRTKKQEIKDGMNLNNQDEKGKIMPRLEKQKAGQNKTRRSLKEKSKYHTKTQDKQRTRPSLRECDSETYNIMSLLTQGLTLL